MRRRQRRTEAPDLRRRRHLSLRSELPKARKEHGPRHRHDPKSQAGADIQTPTSGEIPANPSRARARPADRSRAQHAGGSQPSVGASRAQSPATHPGNRICPPARNMADQTAIGEPYSNHDQPRERSNTDQRGIAGAQHDRRFAAALNGGRRANESGSHCSRESGTRCPRRV